MLPRAPYISCVGVIYINNKWDPAAQNCQFCAYIPRFEFEVLTAMSSLLLLVLCLAYS
jgi:hypothetical protein